MSVIGLSIGVEMPRLKSQNREFAKALTTKSSVKTTELVFKPAYQIIRYRTGRVQSVIKEVSTVLIMLELHLVALWLIFTLTSKRNELSINKAKRKSSPMKIPTVGRVGNLIITTPMHSESTRRAVLNQAVIVDGKTSRETLKDGK